MRDADEREFDEFVRARSGALMRLAFYLLGDWSVAEDVTQSALVRLHRAWPRVAAATDVDAYARRVVSNEANRWWRRPARRETTSDKLQVGNAPDQFTRIEAQDELWRLLMELPKRQRAVIVLRHLEELSEKETADVLGISVGTVKSSASKALSRLRLDATALTKEVS